MAVGVAAGLGHEGKAVICTALALIVFAIMPKVVGWFDPSTREQSDAVLPVDDPPR